MGIEGMAKNEFVMLIPTGVFTDNEIAGKIRTYSPSGAEYNELLEAVSKLKGGTITGPIRTALRAINGLPPVPGD